jgi:hypothetical protein
MAKSLFFCNDCQAPFQAVVSAATSWQDVTALCPYCDGGNTKLLPPEMNVVLKKENKAAPPTGKLVKEIIQVNKEEIESAKERKDLEI